MPYFRRPKDHEHPYAQIANEVLEDGSLSFKAKGILAYLLSRSDDWDVYQSQLADLGPDGETAVRSGIQELMDAGYLERKKRRNEDGTIGEWVYIIHESPLDGDASRTRFSSTGSSNTGSSKTGESQPTNTDEHQDEKNQDGKQQQQHARARAMPIAVYREFYPDNHLTAYQKDIMRQSVQDTATWREVCEIWKGNSYNPDSVKKMLDRYESEQQSDESPPKQQQDGFAAQANGHLQAAREGAGLNGH